MAGRTQEASLVYNKVDQPPSLTEHCAESGKRTTSGYQLWTLLTVRLAGCCDRPGIREGMGCRRRAWDQNHIQNSGTVPTGRGSLLHHRHKSNQGKLETICILRPIPP